MEPENIAFLAAIILSFAIMAFGRKTGANLDGSRKRQHLSRFGFISLIPICAVLLFSFPVIIDYSALEEIDPIEKVELNSPENIAKTVSSQTSHIRALEREVLRLRQDLSDMHKFYERLALYGLLAFLMLGVGIFMHEFGEPEKGEIKADPLNLNDDLS